MKKLFKYRFLTGLILFFSCMTVNLREINISQINVVLKKQNIEADKFILPGHAYFMDISVEDADGKTYEAINLNDLQIRPYNSTMVEVNNSLFGPVLKVSKQMAPFLKGDGYRIAIKVLDNDFPVSIYNWSVDWDNMESFDYSANSGSDGLDGQDGSDNYGSSSFNLVGGDGQDGKDGSRGFDGPVLKFYVFYYDVNHLFIPGYDEPEIRIIYSPETGDLLMVKKDIDITLFCRGGNGGGGGTGGDGGDAGSYTETDSFTGITKTEKGDHGRPGAGGDGGDGGHGGRVELVYFDSKAIEHISVDVSGGRGGEAGEKGDAPIGSVVGFSGLSWDGHDGSDGKLVYHKIALNDMRVFMETVSIDNFDVDRIIEIDD